MKIPCILFCILTARFATGQQAYLKTGDLFPDHIIGNMINAPVKTLNVSKYDQKVLVLNFWGTWCSPCIPEMDALARLQRNNSRYIQVVGISNDDPLRLQRYLQRKPSGIWLASDTASWLYRRFGLDHVGQCAIIDTKHRIVAIMLTDSVNQRLIDRVLKGEAVASNASAGKLPAIVAPDPFGIDSSTLFNLSLKPYQPGMRSMGKGYLNTTFEGRRKTFINVCASLLYKQAYDISSQELVVYENITHQQVCDVKDTAALYCYDLLVAKAQQDSLLIIMQQTLNALLPIKARMEKRTMPVYILTKKGSARLIVSTADRSTYSFSGHGFEGSGIAMKTFVDYLCNELDLPVYDETGLTGKYDIKTENVLRSREDVVTALDRLGLRVEKGERVMPVLVLYRPSK